MPFDWIQFLGDHNIHYVEGGPNTPKGDISVRCPFCQDDPSQHLAINIDGAGWHCWRNRSHAGRSPTKLIQALLGCSFDQARLIAGQTTNLPSNFLEQVQNNLSTRTTTAPREPLTMPKEWKSLDSKSPLARPYRRYLKERGYKYPEALTRSFELYYCNQGAFHGHIMFPIYFAGELVTWTGRSIIRDEELRYRSLAVDPEKAKKEGTPTAIGPINNYLLWYDELLYNPKAANGTICLCEGPFDALRINYLADHYGIFATCFFTNTPSSNQIELLHELLPRYKRRVLLLDEGTLPQQIRTQNGLSDLKIELGRLPKGIKDPGEIASARDLLSFRA